MQIRQRIGIVGTKSPIRQRIVLTVRVTHRFVEGFVLGLAEKEALSPFPYDQNAEITWPAGFRCG
jgi:hypothetical protein